MNTCRQIRGFYSYPDEKFLDEVLEKTMSYERIELLHTRLRALCQARSKLREHHRHDVAIPDNFNGGLEDELKLDCTKTVSE